MPENIFIFRAWKLSCVFDFLSVLNLHLEQPFKVPAALTCSMFDYGRIGNPHFLLGFAFDSCIVRGPTRGIASYRMVIVRIII